MATTASTARRNRLDTRAPIARRRSFIRQPTTLLALAVLVATAVAATVVSGGPSGSAPAAAQVGSTKISVAALEREVSAIQSQPVYAAALGRASATALSAPLDPKVVAAANGDPDDLRITFSPTGNGLRPFTTADLKADVLTRLLYVTALRDLLAAKHAAPTTAELADGRQEAMLNAGTDASGAALFARLPSWYQRELATRGADVEALVRVLFGTAGVTPQAVEEAYQRRVPTDFTTVCLRSVVVAPGQEQAGRAALAAGTDGARDDGCAPLSQWAGDVASAVREAPVGTPAASVTRRGKVALLEVTRRSVTPLSAVSVDVHATLLAGYTDLVNTMVEDELALQKVTVAPQYGTYQQFGSVHDVLPPDALTPPPAASSGPPTTQAPQRQRLDPFD